MGIVLETFDNLSLLWALLVRPALPHILSTAICPTARRIIRPLSSAFFLAPALFHDQPPSTLTVGVYAVSWTPTFVNFGIYLVTKESRYQIEFPGSARFYSAIFALGIDGI
jgi:hypothetical protein